MASCCNDTITPKMIRTGQMKIGDRIQLEDILVSSQDFSAVPGSQNTPEHFAEASVSASAQEPVPEDIPVQASPSSYQNLSSQMQPQMQMQQTQNWAPSRHTMPLSPITYEQMTPYLDQSSVNTQGSRPTVILPQTPMTTLEFTETIDITDVQSYLGFLRTQIGRYMRVEQLMGSNQVESRYGFLVGIGTNYIILQEITSGNIMVVDLFTIRLTYIYYSDPVVPPEIQR